MAISYHVAWEHNTRGDGQWRKSGTIPLTEDQARAKAAEKRARPERYRNVKVMRLDTGVVNGRWDEVG